MAKGKFNINDLLNSQSKGEKAAEAKQEAFRIVNVPIDKLVTSSANLYGIREIEELAASIETMGLLHNLAVREVDGGLYEIISGERRYRACKMLYDAGNESFKALPCKVEESSDTMAELKLIFANATARELTDYEKAEQARRMKELFRQLRAEGYEVKGRLREIVADVLDVSPAQVGRLESVSEKLIPEYKEELKAGNIGISTAYEASTLPQEKQRETLEEYKQAGGEAIKTAVKKRQNAKQRFEEMVRENRCAFGGKCTNSAGIAAHVKNGSLEGCAGCCNQCTEAKNGGCGIVCIPVMQRNLDEADKNRADEVEEIRQSIEADRKSSMAYTAARQLRAVAETVAYDAVCDMGGNEINIRAACLFAIKVLEERI